MMDSIWFWILVAAGLVWLGTRHKRRSKIGRAGFMVITNQPKPPSSTFKLILTLLGFAALAWWGYYIYGTHCHGAC